MVQREVADRLTAQPGGKTFGPLAIWSQLNYAVKNIKNVSPTCFMPAPKVWSAVVRFEKRAAPLADVQDYERFKKLIKLCFTQRRKQIGSNLRKNAAEFFQQIADVAGRQSVLNQQAFNFFFFNDFGVEDIQIFLKTIGVIFRKRRNL